jgi:hypothetical protein
LRADLEFRLVEFEVEMSNVSSRVFQVSLDIEKEQYTISQAQHTEEKVVTQKLVVERSSVSSSVGLWMKRREEGKQQKWEWEEGIYTRVPGARVR